jgi:hypothetical protein
MSHTKDGYGPTTPTFFAFNVPDATVGMYDGRPTNTRAKSPRKPAKIRSNSDPMSRHGGTRRNTNANRKNGGNGMYWSPVEGLGQ